MNYKRSCLGLVVLAVVSFQPAAGQEGDDITRELRRLNDQLQQIGVSLDALLANQKAQLIVRRIELEERRLAPLDREVRGARGDVRNKEAEIRQTRTYRDTTEEELEAAIRAGEELDGPQRSELKLMDEMIKNLETELGAFQSRVFELEDDLARGRERVESLDEQLMELLDPRR